MHSSYKKTFMILFLVFFCSVCYGFNSEAAIRLSKQKLTLKTGSACTLYIKEATQPVKWKLSKKGIVQIVYKGPDQIIIRGKKAGTVKLYAVTDSRKYVCSIKVKKEVSFPKTKTIVVGDNFKLKAEQKGKWRVSKDGIIQLPHKTAKSNLITALTPGKVTVSVRSSRKTYRCKIKVIEIPNDNPQKTDEEAPTDDNNKEFTKDADKTSDDLFPESLSGLYSFGSGAGAWGSNLTLNKDGSFKAIFSKTNNNPGDGYSYSRSVGSCTGRFVITKRISSLCFEMKIVDYKDDIELGTTWIEDSCQFTATGVNGLGSNDNYVFYLKGSPRDTLPEHLRNGGIMISFSEDGLLKTGFIYNVDGGATFVGPFSN